MAVNGTISKTTWTDTTLSTSIKAKATHITELRTAITKLNDTYAANVVNQGNQACQNTCTQCTDKNESCQDSCTQCSSKNESCQDSCTQCSQCNKCNNQSNQR